MSRKEYKEVKIVQAENGWLVYESLKIVQAENGWLVYESFEHRLALNGAFVAIDYQSLNEIVKKIFEGKTKEVKND